ncbi:MAG: membrane protein insertase YidC [Deltaproteobacteria bacterium]|nr:membrane protein insertase YidC [Deltaproteobacteria bacterium]
MESNRTLTAVILSLIILVGYQYLFTPRRAENTGQQLQQKTVQTANVPPPANLTTNSAAANGKPAPPAAVPVSGNAPSPKPATTGRDITVETSLYTAVFSENGGVVKSFKLKKYKETLKPDSLPVELIHTKDILEQPLNFAWGSNAITSVPLFKADRLHLYTADGGTNTLVMTAHLPSGLEITRTLRFSDKSYLINLEVKVQNNTNTALQGSPQLQLINSPFATGSAKTSFLFNGPAVYLGNSLHEVKAKTLRKKGAKLFNGKLSWAAYEGTYFICGILPRVEDANTVRLSLTGKDLVTTTVSGSLGVIPAGGSHTYSYGIYFGPKRLSTMKAVGANLSKAVNFGWFDIIAKPTLYFLNFLNHYIHNYGIAIILVTVFFKLILWPISHKGLKSMKTMQKIQPKMAKLKEKHKDNKEKLNQEMILLYKTYKVNPLGGCLPMIVQIPVFFALYRVLLQTIELRHAPFMLWINDLSAPDRLQIGINIPYLHGIPVLTLLMGASMFLQQKMTPTSADPTQAKVMLFLPVVFTFMFLNFASGLVLYWFVNNLLAIGQQYYINKSIE